MIKYEYLTGKERDFSTTPIHVEPLSKQDGLPIEEKYFDDDTCLTKAPSYVWKTQTNEIVAFVLLLEVFSEKCGLGVQIVGYQSIVKAITFVSDILPSVVKHVRNVNEEKGFPYDYIIFKEDEFIKIDGLKDRIINLGFTFKNEEEGWFYLSIKNENAPE